MHQTLREGSSKIDKQEQFSILRTLKFFHDFSQAEILEVLRASTWQDYEEGEEIVKEGEMDDRFYVDRFRQRECHAQWERRWRT